MAENQLKIRLVTPDRILLDEMADAVEIPGKSGYFDVLYGHAPLLSSLGAGELRIHGSQGGDQVFVVARGFVEVLPERVTILAETAMKPEEVDAGAAHQQLDHAHKLWSEAGEDPGRYAQANAMIAEAEAMLEAAGRKTR